MFVLEGILGGFFLLFFVMGVKSAKMRFSYLTPWRWGWIGFLAPFALIFAGVSRLFTFLETLSFSLMLLGIPRSSPPLPKPTHFYDSIQ